MNFWILYAVATLSTMISAAKIKELRSETVSIEGKRGRVGTVAAIMDDGERKVLFDAQKHVAPGKPEPTVEEQEEWTREAFTALQKQMISTKPGHILDLRKFVDDLPLVVEYPNEPDEHVGDQTSPGTPETSN